MSQCKNCEHNLHHACISNASEIMTNVLGGLFGTENYKCECFQSSPELHRILSSAKTEIRENK